MSVQERHNLYAKMTDGAFDEEGEQVGTCRYWQDSTLLVISPSPLCLRMD